MNDDINAAFGPRTYDQAMERLETLASASGTFADFQSKLISFKRWYLGDPVVEELKGWTLADFKKLFDEVKRT